MIDADSPMCTWVARVSALLDDELPEHEREMVTAHAALCSTCRSIVAVDQADQRPRQDPVTSILDSIPDRLSPVIRVALAIVGGLILFSSTPDFVRGNTMGETLHDLRHLAIWQASIGVAVATAAVTFRLSRLVTIMLVTFLVLTGAAVTYDLLTDHRGPWTDPTHVIEVIAVVLVLRLVRPHLRLAPLIKRTNRQSRVVRNG